MPDKLEKFNKLKELVAMVQDGVNKTEFIKSFQAVIDYIKSAEEKLTSKIDSKTKTAETKLNELNEVYRETITKIEEDNQSTLSNLKRWALERVGELFIKSKVNEELTQRLINVDTKLAEADRRIAEVKPLDVDSIVLKASNIAEDALKPLIPTVPNLEEEIPKLGEKIRDSLEILEGDDLLNKSAIKGLTEELNELRILINRKTMVMGGGGGGGGGGRIVKSYDLSASFNGVLKTFSLPSFWRIVSVHLSSVPNILRETTDYTVDGSAMTITFTSEINASTSLATGQTCIVIYSE